MNFSESKHGHIIIEKLSNQRVSNEFCDAMVLIQGQTFKAHRNVLAANSDYFLSCFKKNKTTTEKITIKFCQNVEAFQLLLKYMYMGVVFINWDNVADLLVLAFELKVTAVINYCTEYLHEVLSTSNCITIHELSMKCSLLKLEKEAIDFISDNISEVLKEEEILYISKKQLKIFLEPECLICGKERLSLLLKWVDYDANRRKHCFSFLLSSINFDEIDSQYLEELIENCAFLINDQKCLYCLLKLLEENHVEIKKYENKLATLKRVFENNSCVDFGSLSYKNIKVDDDLQAENECGIFGDDGTDSNEDTKNQPTATAHKRIKPFKSNHSQRLKTIKRQTPPRRKKGGNDGSSAVGSKEEIFEIGSLTKDVSQSNLDKQKAPKETIGAKRTKINKCSKCSYTSSIQKKMEQHHCAVHATDKSYKCSECDFVWKWIGDYSSHLKQHYNGPPYKCKEHNCDYISSEMRYFTNHLFKHYDTKFQCVFCGQNYKSPRQLQRHISEQHPTEKPHACDQCDACFPAKHMLNDHLSCQHKGSMYLCDVCAFRTKDRRYLTVHKRTHSGKERLCKHPGCTYRTIYTNNLKNHMRTHTGERPYVCSICGKGFSFKSYMLKHELIHQNKFKYKCNLCEFGSPEEKELKIHNSRHHGDGISKGTFRSRKKRLIRIHDSDLCEQNNLDLNPSELVVSKTKIPNSAGSLNDENQSLNDYAYSQICFEQSVVNNLQLRPIEQFQTNIQSHSSLIPAISHEVPTQFGSYMSFL